MEFSGRDVKFYDSQYTAAMPTVHYHIDIDTLSPYIEAAALVEYPNGMTIGPRRIYGYEMILVAEGGYTVHMLDRQYALVPGDVFIVPPNVRHSYRSSGAASHHYVYFFLSKADKARLDKERFAIPKRCSDISFSATFIDALPFHIPAFPRERVHLFSDCAHACGSLSASSLASAELMRKELAIRLLREVMHAAAATDEGQFCRSIRHIDAHFDEDITIADLAACEGLTPNYYSARFKAVYGVAPVTYVTMRRMIAAKEFIRSGTSIRDAARRTGFRDQYYFSNVFKKMTGISPSEYRLVSGRAMGNDGGHADRRVRTPR